MKKSLLLFAITLLALGGVYAQGVGIPTRHAGLGFGNLERFTGIRFNFADKNVEKIIGINTTIWKSKHEEQQTGDMIGLSIGLPLAMGVENQSGVSVGLGVGAKKNLNGLNIGGLGVGAGGNVRGISIAGLGIGAGGDLAGVNIAVLGAGSGGDVRGFNFAGLGIGAGGKMNGVNIGGLGVGAGDDLTGINIGGLGIGAGGDVTGINFGGLGVGAGGRVRGFTLSVVGIGAGESLQGIAIAGIGAGSPSVTGLAIAPVVGGQKVKGIILAPVWLRIGEGKLKETIEENPDAVDGEFTGFAFSIFNRIKGKQRGMTVGVVNYTKSIRGVQLGLINIVKENPKGLRVLPFFNTRFGKKEG